MGVSTMASLASHIWFSGYTHTLDPRTLPSLHIHIRELTLPAMPLTHLHVACIPNSHAHPRHTPQSTVSGYLAKRPHVAWMSERPSWPSGMTPTPRCSRPQYCSSHLSRPATCRIALILQDKLEMDSTGYLARPAGYSSRTSVPGVFAAGDVQDKAFHTDLSLDLLLAREHRMCGRGVLTIVLIPHPAVLPP